MKTTLVVLIVSIASLVSAAEVPLSKHASVVFGTAEQASSILGAHDDFVKTLGPLERQIRLRSTEPVSRQQMAEFSARQALTWTDAEISGLTEILQDFESRTAAWQLPFPKEIQFVKTTGAEESGTAYCRGTAVIFAKQILAQPAKKLRRTVVHELFHVLSNANPELRDRMYKIVGFRKCNPFELPASLRDLRLTNPDAFRLEHYIELKSDDDAIHAIPILYSNSANYSKGGLFDYLQFKLAVVQVEKEQTIAVMDANQPRLLDPGSEPDYHRQVGRNTGYILHPEEVLADNFVHLVIGNSDLPNPEIVQQLKEVLQGS